MCNAWNHSPSCKCGWGGDGHLGKNVVHYSRAMMSNNMKFNSVSSYTVPNARCPVCNASVHFYQSPNGGRVFFDELGPPWPKHGCTNASSSIAMTVNSQTRDMSQKLQKNQFGEWTPFVVDDVLPLPPSFLFSNLRGWSGSIYISIYINFKLDIKAPYFFKKMEDGTYQIATLINEKNCSLIQSRIFKGYSTLYDLSKHEEVKSAMSRLAKNPEPSKKSVKIKTHKTDQINHKTGSKLKNKHSPKKLRTKNKFDVKKVNPQIPTIMQIAFANAKNM